MSEVINVVKNYLAGVLTEAASHEIPLVLRILLVIVSFVSVGLVLRKIRKKQLHIDDALYWIVSSAILLILSIFPQIVIFVACLLQIAPTTFVFLVVILVVLFKIFALAIELSVQKQRLNTLVQKLALANKEIDNNKKMIAEKDKEKEKV